MRHCVFNKPTFLCIIADTGLITVSYGYRIENRTRTEQGVISLSAGAFVDNPGGADSTRHEADHR